MDEHKRRLIHSSADCHWRTGPDLYGALDRIFHFDIDLAATAENCLVQKKEINHDLNGYDLLDVYLGPDHPATALRDALTVAWHTVGKVGFLNPPFSLTLYSQYLEQGIPREELGWLRIENWAWKAYQESLKGFTTIGVFPYAPQTEWFRQYVMGHALKEAKANGGPVGWSGHAALDCWRIPHRVSFLRADGKEASNAGVNTCIIQWSPNPGFVGPWSPSMRYWSFR